MQQEYDIAIVGGGLVGASLASCMANSSLRVIVLEQASLSTDTQPSYDDRGLALSLASCRIMNAINIWPDLVNLAVPIKHIHVSDRGKLGFVRFHAADFNLDALGYVVIAHEIGNSLHNKISTLDNVDYFSPVIVSEIQFENQKVNLTLEGPSGPGYVSCRLLVAADGSNSVLRQKMAVTTHKKDFGQTAIVSNLTMESEHDFTAYERFTNHGPLALLPVNKHRFVSVFTVTSNKLQEYTDMSTEEYIRIVQQTSSKRIGKIVKIGSRKSFPLQMIRVENQTNGRAVLLGNSAHTIHPNGAQGFNLGLRDAVALAELLRNQELTNYDPGSKQILQDYCNFRIRDQQRVIDFTDTLASLFYSDNWLKSLGRNSGMIIMDTFPGLKRKFAKMAMGIDGKQPALVRGLRLEQI